MRLVIDAMSGDRGCEVAVTAALSALAEHSRCSQCILVGDEPRLQAAIEQALQAVPALQSELARVSIEHSDGVMPMTARPRDVLRGLEPTSMRTAVAMLADGRADVCVSAGNTGAMLALSRHLLGSLEGIRKPAICAQLPSLGGLSYLLDVGANVDCSAAQLHQFAQMGTALVSAVHGIAAPKARALSIGREAGKGNEVVTAAAALCAADPALQFAGLVEGDELLTGDCEVIFCDGFVGNVALKTSEGTANYIRAVTAQHFASGSSGAASGKPPASTLQALQELGAMMNPARYNGACLLGLNKLVFKTHGNSCETGWQAAIDRALSACDADLVARLDAALTR